MARLFFVFCVVISTITPLSAKKNRLIIWSIDGFAAGYLSNPVIQKSAVWQRLLKRGIVFNPVETTIPALTYPAHTAMVTGFDTALHGLYGNHPVDPFNLSKNGWTWFTEDIRKKPLWDIVREQKKRVANILWPVTMMDMRRIHYHFPQFDRAKGEEEIKLMRVLSTPTLYREVERNTQISLTEYSSDIDRIRVAKYIWQKKKPNLMLLYTPGLDSIQHANGEYSKSALEHLELLGVEIEKFLKEIYRKKELHTALLIVSDHGFTTFKGMCFPNTILHGMGFIESKVQSWSYFFDTAGGVARLLHNGDTTPFPIDQFKKNIKESCPDIDVVDRGHADFERLQKKYDRNAELFLVARAQVLLSRSWAGKEVYSPKVTGHTHGFLPERKDMQTVAIAFTPHKERVYKIRYTKDIFRFACNYLGLKCPATK
ncbi:MAG: hypothetical protein LDLANPLL_02431 [Turneriella sp.]|nr:hypothetical protein [Turneriella sp.]